MKAPAQRRGYADMTDMALVEAAQTGDAQAFGVLFARYNDEIHGFLSRLCSNSEVAQELAQDVWERALRSIHRLTYGSPQAWLMTIARNRAYDHFRSHRVRLAALVDHTTGDLVVVDTAPSVEDQAEAIAVSADVRDLVRTLPEPQQAALILTYWLGMNSHAAGAVMGKSPEAVKALTLRGRRAIAKQLSLAGAL